MSNDLMEPIYDADIGLLAEDINSMAETVHRIQKRLIAQGAPQDLVGLMGQAIPPLDGVVKFLMDMKPYFPEEPPPEEPPIRR